MAPPPPLRPAAACFPLAATSALSPSAWSACACEIHTALTYTLPGGPLGRLVDRLFLRRMFQRNVIDTAVCLAENYRTDTPVDPARLAELRSNAL